MAAPSKRQQSSLDSVSKRLRSHSDVSESELSTAITSPSNRKDDEDAESRSAVMSSFPPTEVAQGTTGEFANDFSEFAQMHADEPYCVGEILEFPKIKQRDDLKFLEARVISSPEEDDDDDDDYFNITIKVTIEVDSTIHSLDDAGLSEDFKEILTKWITNDNEEKMKITTCTVNPCDEDDSDNDTDDDKSSNSKSVSVTVRCDSDDCETWFGNVVKSPFLDEVWNKHMYSLIAEGVCYADHKVPDLLRDSLRAGIDDVAKNTVVDYHPNSNDIVRDLVHPALYPYIKGVSRSVPSLTPVSLKEKSDFWQRSYEDSNYQWLPTPFKVFENGECSILEYINNLDRAKFPRLYKDLERLFEIFLPYFEEVWSYAKALELWEGDDDNDFDYHACVVSPLKKEPVSFKGRELQVIPKIVEYTLKPGQSYEGVWHCEGMSHENIVMTGIYFLDRDGVIDGGSLRFKRAFTVEERNIVFSSIPQSRPRLVNEAAYEGFVPLGEFPTEKGRLLVFPNCHVHKVAKMENISDTESARRRIVVFFFVNPEKQIISTREVPPQQGVISLADAKAHRLKLMAERKYDKMRLNVRDIELCEH